MATKTGTTTTSNGNVRSVRLTSSRSGTKITWTAEFKSLYNLQHSGLTWKKSGASSGSGGVSYYGTNVWVTVSTWTTTISQGSTHSQTFTVTVPAVSATPKTTTSVTLSESYPASKPSKPSKPTVSNIGTTTATAKIGSLPAANGASITNLRWTVEGISGTTSSGTSLSKALTGLSPNDTYRVKVEAGNSVGYSTASDWSASFTTKPLAPNAPSGLSIVYTADNNIKVSFSLSVTNDRPVSNVRLVRRDNVNTTAVALANHSSGTRTITDSSAAANRRLDYYVEAVGAGGTTRSSTYVSTNTTPGKPAKPVADRDGTNVALTLTPLSSWPSQVTHIIIRDYPGGATSPTTVATIAKGTSYTHVSPNSSVSHNYDYAGRVGASGLIGAYSDKSGVINVLAPPAAPTLQFPLGGSVDFDKAISFKFKHNPTDSSLVTKAQIRVRPQGGSTWTTPASFAVTASDGVVTRSFTATQLGLASGVTYEWQASTWGSHATQGVWSSSGVFTTSVRPVGTWDMPSVWDAPVLVGQWGYYDEEGTDQSKALVELWDNETNTRLGTKTVNGSANTYTFSNQVANGGSYYVLLTVWDGNSIPSDVDRWDFTVTYTEPFVPLLDSVGFDRDTGAAVVRAVTSGREYSTAWTDTADNSASILYKDGVEVARNHAPNPSFEAPGATVEVWRNLCYNPSLRVGGTGVGVSNMVMSYGVTLDGREGATYRVLAPGNATAYDAGNPVSEVGGFYAARITVAAADPAACGGTVAFLLHDGNNLTARKLVTLPSSVGEPLTVDLPSLNASTMVDVLRLYVYRQTGENLADGAGVHVSERVIQKVSGVGQSVSSGFFDHLYSPDPDLTPSAVETPNASASILTGALTVYNYSTGQGVAIVSEQWAMDRLRSARLIRNGKNPNSNNWFERSYPAGTIGPWVALRATAHVTDAIGNNNPHLQIAATGAPAPNSVTVNLPNTPGDYTETIMMDVSGATGPIYWRLIMKPTLTDAQSGGETLWWDNLTILTADTEAELQAKIAALDAVGGYFDGETYGARIPVESLSIERSVAGGEWTTVLEDLPPDASVAEFTIPLGVEVCYRPVAWSAIGSSATGNEICLRVGLDEAHGYLGAGAGYADTVALKYNPEVEVTTGLSDQVLVYMAGRDKPMGFDGPATSRAASYSGSLITYNDEQTVESFERVVKTTGPKLFRTPDGLYLEGQLAPMSLTRRPRGELWDVSFQITETGAHGGVADADE